MDVIAEPNTPQLHYNCEGLELSYAKYNPIFLSSSIADSEPWLLSRSTL